MTIGRRRIAADPDVLGKTLVVAGQPLTIVGVAPRGFRRHDARRRDPMCSRR